MQHEMQAAGVVIDEILQIASTRLHIDGFSMTNAAWHNTTNLMFGYPYVPMSSKLIGSICWPNAGRYSPRLAPEIGIRTQMAEGFKRGVRFENYRNVLTFWEALR